MKLYLIRHKATGQFMPSMKRGRGYSHCNPGATEHLPYNVAPHSHPRFCVSREQAQRVIVGWAAFPNAWVKHHFDDDEDFRMKSDGRSKDDLEIVPELLILETGTTFPNHRMTCVFIVESGEYEQRGIFDVYDSLDAAVKGIKKTYPPPYVVTWSEVLYDRVEELSKSYIVGKFKAVSGYSTEHTARYDITQYDIKH